MSHNTASFDAIAADIFGVCNSTFSGTFRVQVSDLQHLECLKNEIRKVVAKIQPEICICTKVI